MPTKRIAKVDCWNRRFVDKEEAIGLLNLTKPEFEQFIEPKVNMLVGNNYDIDTLHNIMHESVMIKRER